MRKLFLISFVFLIYGCSYDLDSALRNGDVIDNHGQIENIDKLENFIDEMNNQEQSSVRITRFTDEGDPLLIDLSYDPDDGLRLDYDPTRDEYSNEESYSTQCETVEYMEDGYYVTGCDENQLSDVRLAYYIK